MKKFQFLFLLLGIAAFTFSCEDENLDPLQLKKVKKGRILALRGAQLQNIYYNGKPGAELFPRIAKSTDKFEFETEYLAPDPESLESVDVYALVNNEDVYFYDKDYSNEEIITLRKSNIKNSNFETFLTTEALYNSPDGILYLAVDENTFKKFTLLQKYLV